MALKVSAADGIKIYNLSSGKSLPEWVSGRRRKEKTDGKDQHLELLQDFRFPNACQRIRATAEGDCVIATGNYPPQVRLFDVAQLSSKVTRHFDADITDFEVLTDDFSKLAFLCGDRSVKFHARFGHYHQSRIPINGRAMEYVPFLAQLLVVGSSAEMHRIDLCEGRFLNTIDTLLPSINACDLSSVHGLVCCAGSDGSLACIDVRQQAVAGSLDVARALCKSSVELTAVKFALSGLHMSVGTSDGSVSLFDLRSQKPIIVKEHMYDAPINSIYFLNAYHKSRTNLIASADSFIVKIWDTTTGETYTNIEPGKSAAINHVSWWNDSGLFFVACDEPKIQSYFIPSLGAAPFWCSFLEGMTEELEEDAGRVLYDDYKFVTQEQLHDVGLSHLLGTDLLKAYMHGYFVHNKLYTKACLMNKPAQPQPVAIQEGRISSVKKAMTAKNRKKENETSDERFKAIYEDPAFQIDEDRDPFLDDSLLVPTESVLLENESRSAVSKAADDTLKSFESRTAQRREPNKKRQSIGPKQFDFLPKKRRSAKKGKQKKK